MAPNADAVKLQTERIIWSLLVDDDKIQSRTLHVSDVETDGPGNEDHFDPVLVADKLRTIGDALNEDVMFKDKLKDLGKSAAMEALEAVFIKGVEDLCKTYVSKGAEVAPELQLIKVSVAVGLYVKKVSPELTGKVKDVLTTFLNNRVGAWITEQGGWDKVPVSQ